MKTKSVICYSCVAEIPSITAPDVGSFIDRKGKQEFQCEDCMNGSNCFTCEFCGNGLATEQVDYEPSGYREWWCFDCAENEDRARSTNILEDRTWIFEEKED